MNDVMAAILKDWMYSYRLSDLVFFSVCISCQVFLYIGFLNTERLAYSNILRAWQQEFSFVPIKNQHFNLKVKGVYPHFQSYFKWGKKTECILIALAILFLLCLHKLSGMSVDWISENRKTSFLLCLLKLSGMSLDWISENRKTSIL